MRSAFRFFLEHPEGAVEQLETIYADIQSVLDTLGDLTCGWARGNPETIGSDGDWSVTFDGVLYTVYCKDTAMCETTYLGIAVLVYNSRRKEIR